MRVAALIVLAVVWLRPLAVEACSFPAPPPLEIDPALLVTDHSRPSLTEVSIVEVKRGRGVSGCGGSASSCDDLGVIRVAVAATDDMTASNEMGFNLAITSGSSPPVTVPQAPVVVGNTPGEMVLVWIDGNTDDQEELDFEIQIVAVDRAGNQSTPRSVRVVDGGSGCSLAAGSPRQPGSPREQGSARQPGSNSSVLGALAIASLALAALTRGRTRAGSRRRARVPRRFF